MIAFTAPQSQLKLDHPTLQGQELGPPILAQEAPAPLEV